MIPTGALPYWMTLTIDGRVLAVLVLVCVVSVFVFGLAPALHLLRVDVNQIIKDSGRLGAGGVPARRWTTAFLAVEFALTLVLLAVVVGGVRQQWVNQRAEFQLDSAPLLSMWVTLPDQTYASPESRVAFYDAVAERFASLPGVESVAIASVLPRVSAPLMQLEIAGRESSADGALPTVVMVGTGDNYFETLGMPLVRGRRFTRIDGSPGQETAIVNQRLVDMFFGTRDPLGQLIRIARPGTAVSGPWARIVGVAPTVRQRPGGINPIRLSICRIGRPPQRRPRSWSVRPESRPAWFPSIREELRRLDPNLPLYRVMSLQQAMDESGWNGRMAEVDGPEHRDHRVADGTGGSLRGDGTRRSLVESGARSSNRARRAAPRYRVDRVATGTDSARSRSGCRRGVHVCLRSSVHCRRSSRSGQADGHGRASFAHGVDWPRRHRRLRDSGAPGDTRRSGVRCGRDGECKVQRPSNFPGDPGCDDLFFDCSTPLRSPTRTRISIARWCRISRCWKATIAAVAAARRALGSVALTKDLHRDARSFIWLDDGRQDLRFAARMLLRSPGFAAVVILTMAISIGATTTLFSLAYGVLMRPLPWSEPDRLVRLQETRGGRIRACRGRFRTLPTWPGATSLPPSRRSADG